MKKYTAAICLITSLLFLSSCDVFLNPTSDDNSNTEKTSQKESDKESDKTQTFEYTAENNVPARKTPFDKKLCYEKINALELSDGDWTLNDIYISEDVVDSKIILSGTAAQNKITWKSAVTKLDMSATTEASTESQQASSESIDFTDTFNEIKPYIFGENSDYVTFSNGYLTDDEVVYIANIQLDKIETICKIENKISHSEIMTNPNHTKYVIPYTDDDSGDDSGFIYLYKNANLNDKETVPENNETETTLSQLYNAKNDVPAATAPFDASVCTENNKPLSFTNGKWKIVDIALRSETNSIADSKTISEVTYNAAESNPYNCTATISKYDIPKNSNEENFDYEGFYTAHSNNPYYKTFSHGYSTEDSHVIILENKPEVFKQIYIDKISTVPASQIFSNTAGTKYVIPYTGNGFPQTIYIYKVAIAGEPSFTEPTLPASVGTDPFKGKTFLKDTDDETGEKYVFGNDGTVTYYQNRGGIKLLPAYKAAYTYNSTTKLLSTRYIEMPQEDGIFVSFNEYLVSIEAMVIQESASASDAETYMTLYTSMAKTEFEKLCIYKAEIINNNLSIQTDYFTEVPDVKNLFLHDLNYKNNFGIEIIMDFDGETRKLFSGFYGNISIKTPHESGTHVKDFRFTDITENEIKAHGSNEIWWDGPSRNEELDLCFTYSVVRNSDGTLTFTISGKDDVTKTELGASVSSPNPTYELKSKGASIIDAVTN